MQIEAIKTQNFDLRAASGKDLNFIFSTWLNAYRYFGFAPKGCRNSIFFPEYNKVIDYILSKPETSVLIACVPDNPSVILGYMVHEPTILHFAFVKEYFRDLGIGRAMFQKAFGETDPEHQLITTHQTKEGEGVMRKHAGLLEYNPFILFKQGETSG